MFKHAVTRLKPQVSASSMLQVCSELKEMTLLASRLLRLAFFLGSFNHVWGACFKLNVRGQSFFLLDSRLCRFKTLSFLVRQGVQFYCFCSRMIWFADPLYHHCANCGMQTFSIHLFITQYRFVSLKLHVCSNAMFVGPHSTPKKALNTPRCCLMAS